MWSVSMCRREYLRTARVWAMAHAVWQPKKSLTVCRLLTMQSHVPVKMAASHTDCGHNSTPESSPTIAGLDAIDERTVIKKTDKIPASNKNFFMLSPPIAIDRIKRVLLAIHRFAAEFLFAWHCILLSFAHRRSGCAEIGRAIR